MRHILRHKSPKKVEARRLFVFVFYPTATFQRSLHVAVASLNDENFRVRLNSVLLLPLFHVRDVELYSLDHRLIALQEVVKGLWIYWGSWFSRRWT